MWPKTRTWLDEGKVLYDFVCGGPGELTVHNNEVLTILNQNVGDGWWEAKNSRGEKGLVPEAYIEIISVPEPSFPPPPPPKWQPSPQTAPSIPPSRPQPPQSQDTWDPPPPTRDNWKSTTGNSVSTWQQSNNTANHGNVGRPLKHESSEDWDEDDDWDDEDDDSVVSGEMDYQGGIGGCQRRERDHKHVRKPIVGRFSSFGKQFVEAYLFDFDLVPVPAENCQINVVEGSDGPYYQHQNDLYSCTITSPKKETKFRGMKSFIVYQITPTFSGIQVSRRYKHFDWLHDRLVDKFPTVAVPPLPEKQISGRFEDDFIQARQRGLQLWMDRMCKHPVVSDSEVFRHFLTCTDEKKWKAGKRQAEKDQYQQGKVFLVVQSPSVPLNPQETDDTLEKFTKFVKVMDDSVKQVSSVGESNAKRHESTFSKEFKRVGGAFISLSKSFEYDNRVDSNNLTKAIEHTGKTYESIGYMYQEQPRNDMIPLLVGINEYKGLLAVFPDVMAVHKGFTSKIQENAGKYSDSEIEQMQSRASVATYTILAEMNHFQQHRVTDFKSYMQEFLKGQIAFYQQITQKLQETLAQYETA
ncbi:hypothetical protein LSH36_275g05015 [Paralvinella palmiformis]|uniref:Sorting nexin n=1 Tax=Paralvinella palmiformis TaxID=53620 RepID=A0AAD9JK25_9ANNE|nr:hypothetical protein LSH36_275g05015 [Paralvinella palmiformis]